MSFLKKMITWFNNLKLDKKILYLYFSLIVLLISILTVCTCTFTASTLRKNQAFSLQQNFNQSISYLTYKLDVISSASDMLIYNLSLNAILNQEPALVSSGQQTADSKELLHTLKNIEENDGIIQARVYVPDQLSYSGNGVNICPLSQAEASVWWDSLFVKKGIHLFVGSQDLEDHPYRCPEGIALFRAMYRKEDYSKLAFIVRLDVSIDAIEPILTSANFTNDSTTLLLDSSNRIIAHSENGDTAFTQSLPTLPSVEDNVLTRLTLSSKKYMVLQRSLPQTDWRIITFVPYDTFNIATLSLVRSILIVSITILLMGILLSRPIVRTITSRIERLCNSMAQTRDGDLTPVTGEIYADEIGSLYENYNYMLNRIRQLLRENYDMGLELKSAEYKALQSQINPHFLYNTLDMIIWLSYENKTEEIQRVVFSLSRFYKLSLAKGKYIVPLSDELEHVSHYVKIQEMRFQGSIFYHADVNPELLKYSIPKITLQPIVENAILHGILEKETKQGTINITGNYTDFGYELVISDDGIGMDLDHLPCLDETGPDISSAIGGSHYGLKNIHRRIKLLYGDPYGLSFESTPMKGTKIHISLPCLQVDELNT